ncbi:MAG TPA: DUF4191 domain-containing protein [Cellulomonas sp.]
MARTSTTGSTPARSSSGKDAGTPKKTRWYKQVWQVYQMTRETDPAVTWWMAGTFVGILVIGLVVGLVAHNVLYFTLLAIPFGAIAAMFLLTRRAESAAYAKIEGQPGASLSALSTIRRGWTFAQEPVQFDPRTSDAVFRGIGRPGVVLVAEGPTQRVGRLVDAERKRVSRVVSGAPVIVIQVGSDEGQVALRKLPRAVQKLKPKLTKAELAVIDKRLTALGTMKLPIPKGIDPMKARPDRKGARGR